MATTNKTTAKNFNIFKTENWHNLKFDARKVMFKGFTREEFNNASEKASKRFSIKFEMHRKANQEQKRRELIEFFKNVPYTYEGEGNEDFLFVQKPTEKGYIAICQGERGNNVYTEDKLLVKYLTAKYNKHFNN